MPPDASRQATGKLTNHLLFAHMGLAHIQENQACTNLRATIFASPFPSFVPLSPPPSLSETLPSKRNATFSGGGAARSLEGSPHRKKKDSVLKMAHEHGSDFFDGHHFASRFAPYSLQARTEYKD